VTGHASRKCAAVDPEHAQPEELKSQTEDQAAGLVRCHVVVDLARGNGDERVGQVEGRVQCPLSCPYAVKTVASDAPRKMSMELAPNISPP
jgi:hypothetical protein